MSKETVHYVYILLCSDNSYYIGKTNNIVKRLESHNGVKKGGAKYTRSRRPVYLVYYECLPNKSEALKREYCLKKLSRFEKETLVKINNPVA